MKTATLVLLSVLGATAQTPPGFEQIAPRFAMLARYLELTPQQITGLARIEMDFQQFIAAKQNRANHVQVEIRELTLAPVVDPNALGLRYMELEMICRESKGKDEQTRGEARKLMTPAQLARLDALEQAYKMLPLVAQADAVHLIDAPVPAANLASGVSSRFPGCRYAEPGLMMGVVEPVPGPSVPPR